jgi:hypothetical protein
LSPFWYESCIVNPLEEASYGRHKKLVSADVKCPVVMTPDDLRKSGLGTLGKKWK